jgi:hypothetical protein
VAAHAQAEAAAAAAAQDQARTVRRPAVPA